MSGFKKLELDFLWEISNVLTKNGSEEDFVLSLKSVFEKYLNAQNFGVFIWDERASRLRDFVKDWIFVDKNKQQEKIDEIYASLQNSPEKSFILNGKVLGFLQLRDLEANFSNCMQEENNLLYFPVINEKKVLGLIELEFGEVIHEIKSRDFLISLGIGASQISAAVINKILNRKMLVNINFHNVMKNIAKLIETQYDLTYILPIIGEMVDKFAADHLIYIFMISYC